RGSSPSGRAEASLPPACHRPWMAPLLRLLPAEKLEVGLDRDVRLHQCGQDLGTWASLLPGPTPLLEKGPQTDPDGFGEHDLQVLERRSSQHLVTGVQPSEGDDERLPGESEGQQGEDVLQAAVGAVAEIVVDER